jgi:uncharacterized protein YkwD
VWRIEAIGLRALVPLFHESGIISGDAAFLGSLKASPTRKEARDSTMECLVKERVLPFAAAILCLVGVFGTACAETSSTRLNVAERYLLVAANQDRVARGLQPLRFDPVLAQAAYYHAREMAAHSEISHQFPGEPDLLLRGAKVGARFSVITENVAEAPNSSMIHDMWMHSPGHRANLLDPAVSVVGISVVLRGREFYAVEDFANSVEQRSLPEQEASVGSLLERLGLQTASVNPRVATIDEARQTCRMESGYAGSHKPWFIMRYTTDSLERLPAELESRMKSGRYRYAVVGACDDKSDELFSSYNIAVLLYP